MRPVRLVLWATMALVPAITAIAAVTPIMVNQSRRAFSLRELHIKRGEVVRFTNVDEFLHQIYVDAPSFKFSSSEQAPGQVVDVAFPVSGTFEVRCEIHPKMMMTATVD